MFNKPAHGRNFGSRPIRRKFREMGLYAPHTQKSHNLELKFHLTETLLYDIIKVIFFFLYIKIQKESAAYATLLEKGWEDLLSGCLPQKEGDKFGYCRIYLLLLSLWLTLLA